MSIGERIKNLRIKCDLSQEELAEYIGTTKQAIFKYETGIVTNIPSDKIEKMAELLKCSPAYLMGWETIINNNASCENGIIAQGDNNTSTFTSNTNVFREMSKQAAELVRIYEELDIRSQNKLLSFAYELEDEYIKKNKG